MNTPENPPIVPPDGYRLMRKFQFIKTGDLVWGGSKWSRTSLKTKEKVRMVVGIYARETKTAERRKGK